jgi:3-deoxy-D-manno-octulosonate cytidylyltransferase
VLTPELPSGTHRAAHVARKINCRFVLNLQGDEPFMDPNLLNALVARLAEGNAAIATAVHESADPDLYRDPNCVKAVLDSSGNALYFSRSPVPFDRTGACSRFLRHVGLYGFTREALLAAVELPEGMLEHSEGLEQLRWLEAGMRIACIRTDWNGIGVDTPDDLRRAEDLLERQAREDDAR